MLLHFLKCTKNTESKNPKVARTKNGRIMLLSKCGVCDSKKLKFIKQQEARKSLSKLGKKNTFKWNSFIRSCFVLIVLNKLTSWFLWAGDKFMPEMHLRQPGFTYSACESFAKNKERIQEFKETRDSQYIYQNELDKTCFQHDMAYRDFKDLTRRTASDKVLYNKAFIIAKNSKYNGYQRGLVSMVYKFLIKRLLAAVLKMRICQTSH